MGIGWIKLHRKILDCFIWQDKPYDKARAWIDLLLLAMHHEKKLMDKGNVYVINRGSYFTSRIKLAERWGWSTKKVDAYLNMLEKENMVTTVRTEKGTTITIVNYDNYQLVGTTEDIAEDIAQYTTEDIAEVTTKDTAEDTQNKNIKNNKNEKNEKKERKEHVVYFPNDELLDNAFKEFLTMRNKIKKPLATKQALTRMMNKIEKLSGGDNDLAIKILNQSTDHCWQDVYELKTDNSGKRSGSVGIDWDNV